MASDKVFSMIEPISKKDRIVVMMREAILSGSIESGEAIVESRVAQQLGVGQPLVREALIELEHQGFVQRVPYRGTYVTKLSADDVEQIFRLRVEMEALATEWAKQNATAEDVAALKNFAEAMKQAGKKLDLPKFYENDLAFHRKIWQMSGNKYLTEALERVVIPLFAFFLMKKTREVKSYVHSADEHTKIAAAFAKSDATTLRKLMQDSMEGWKEDMLRKLRSEDE
ncbi:MAG TPA: GntR family transcriptional regulator [Blastocatellia bacterium]|nr:GntR family transcriptional regulator [Blastocatellia bacterium]